MYPQVESSVFPLPVELQASRDVSLVNPFLAGSAILRVKPMVNLMFESVVLFEHGSGETTSGVFGYASWELPFRR